MTRPVIPEGTLIEVTMTIRMPCAATPEQLEEWLQFDVGNAGSLSDENPLRDKERESWGTINWHDNAGPGWCSTARYFHSEVTK